MEKITELAASFSCINRMEWANQGIWSTESMQDARESWKIHTKISSDIHKRRWRRKI